ncbi:TonB-dependent receptor [Mucilaginibacter achroorhodeus]|uniref:TonB-dependent receptor n=2 Tax=Mucilaginibacter achroorhodeus TaxID=2599294 RepID=A0A563U5V8_9SPHI|nr:TonB-dependent receptor [Mucilaginibacter achroorhodeus]
MIIFYRKPLSGNPVCRKLLTMMKLVFVLLLTGLLQVHANVFSQKLFNIDKEQVTVSSVLKQIEQSSEYSVFYRLDQLDKNRLVTIHAHQASIEDLLTQVLKGQALTYHVVDHLIIIKPSGASIAPIFAITGIVTDEQGQTLPGVTVKLSGTNLATVTDVQGKYSLTLPSGEGNLEFTFIGFVSKTVAVNGQQRIDVRLTADSKALTEVVVVGYTTQRKKDLTGAVSVVDVKNLNKTASSSVNTQLQGQAPGVTVIGSGQPGEEPQVRIRGFNTFGNNTPLYVVDGIPTQDVSTLNPNDVESFQVLKDASSASIYGARAANGVIIITTKRGRGKVTIQYDAYYGTQVPKSGNVWQTLNPQEMADLKHLAQTNSGITDFTDEQYNPDGKASRYTLPDYIVPAGAKNGDPATDPSLYYVNPNYTSGDDFNNFNRITKANKAGTDWYHEIFKSAPITSHNIAVGSGGENGSYLFSANYYNQQGTLIDTYQKRYTLRANSTFNFNKHIRIGENLAYSVTKNPKVSGNNPDGVITMALRQQPIIPVYDIAGNYAGSYGSGLGDANNPVAIQQRSKVNSDVGYRLFGNIYAEADFLNSFTFRTSFGGDIANGNSHYFNYPTYENKENTQTNSYGEDSYSNWNYTWTNTLSFHKEIRKHDIKVVAGTEAFEEYDSYIGASRQNYFSFDPDYVNLNTGSASGIGNYGARSTSTLLSAFARVDYSYGGKYLFNATIRRDGSSKFSKENQYGYFPAVSAAWRLSQENFLKNVSWLSDLKIRGGWGIMGNQLNLTQANAYYTYGSSIGQSYYPIGGGTTIVPGFYQQQIGNPDAKWEKDINSNIGFDATLFGGALSVTADYYRKDIKDLLFNPEQLGTVGNGTVPYVNIAKMRTDGLDVAVTGKTKIGSDLTLNTTLSVTTYNNRISKVSNSSSYFYSDISRRFDVNMVRNEVGHPIGQFYGYKVVGFWNSQDEIDAANAKAVQSSGNPNAVYQNDVKPGRFRYADVNGDGVVNDADRTFIGDPNPDFTAGLNLGLTYKAFDFNILLYGSFGNQIWNNVKYWRDFYASFETAKSYTALYDSWTPTNHNAKAPIQELDASTSSGSTPNSYFVENGSYVRARNAQLGYTFTNLKKAGIQKLRIYVSATNLFTITGYKGTDPELNGGVLNFGIDEGTYATPRTYLIGVNVSL